MRNAAIPKAVGTSMLAFLVVVLTVVVILPTAVAASQQETFRQWRNAPGTWTPGEINRGYAEGDVVPHWINWSGAVPGSEATFAFSYEWSDASGHTGHDYLDDVNETETAQLVSGLSTAAIPPDPEVVSALGSQPSGSFRFAGFEILSIEGPVGHNHGDRTDKYYIIDVRFTAAEAHLFYGAHLARASQWSGGGASQFSGGNLENRFDRDGIEIGSQADQTLGIIPRSIAPEGSIRIVKLTDPPGATGFVFETSWAGSLTLGDGDMWVSGLLEPGTYSVGEVVPTGWSLDAATCDDGSPPASIELADNETVTCTFLNVRVTRSVTVVKKANQPGSFDFTLLPVSTDSVTVQSGGSHKWTGLVDTGTKYTLSEAIPGGWSLIEAACNTEFVWTDNYVEFNLGESDVTCTFTNYKPSNGTTTTTTTLPPPLGEIGDLVWEDPTANGIQESGEKGVPDVQVKLFKGGSLVAATSTDALGRYKFGGLAAGVYEVQFVLPAGFEFTLANENGDDATDSDADPITGKTGGITLVAGEIDHTWDAGIFRPARVLPQVVTTTTPEVLPFTGPPDSPGLAGLAASLVALGGMALISMKRREDQPSAGWSRRLPEVG